MFPIRVECPRCHHDLMDTECMLEERATVKVGLRYKDKRGYAYLSSLYGSGRYMETVEVPDKAVANFYCPFCETDLATTDTCQDCGAALLTLHMVQGGKIEICSRKGCRNHQIAFPNGKKHTVAHIVQKKIYSVRETSSLEEVAKKFKGTKSSALPVIDAHQYPVGIVRNAALMKAIYSNTSIRSDSASSSDTPAEESNWKSLNASDIMESAINYISPDTSLYDAGLLMVQHNLDLLLVVHENTLIGVLSMPDLLNALIDFAIKSSAKQP